MKYLHDPRLWPLVFLFVWIGAWSSNGCLGTHFDLPALKDLGLFIIAKYGADSCFNTPKGAI